MKKTIASWKLFKQIFPDADEKLIKIYFDILKHNVIIENGKVVYPTREDLVKELSKIRKELYDIEKRIKSIYEFNKYEQSFFDELVDKFKLIVDSEYRDLYFALGGDILKKSKKGREFLLRLREDKEFREYIKLAKNNGILVGNTIKNTIQYMEKLKSYLINNLENRKKQLELKERAYEEILKYVG
jgi:hypothetical protein